MCGKAAIKGIEEDLKGTGTELSNLYFTFIDLFCTHWECIEVWDGRKWREVELYYYLEENSSAVPLSK